MLVVFLGFKGENNEAFYITRSFILSLATSAQAVPPALRLLATDIISFSRTALMRNPPLPPALKESITTRSTKGYRTSHQNPPSAHLDLPTRVTFLDATCRVFVPLHPHKKFSRGLPPPIRRDNDHTVSVELKKVTFLDRNPHND